MRIGLDFDNTLSRYDHVFFAEARSEKLVPAKWHGNKTQLRDFLLSTQDGEMLWQKLQGRVYGPKMFQAKLFPGVAQFLVRCKYRGDEVFIVSHKTEYGHYDPTKTPLREAALKWMELRGLFNKKKFGLSRDHVFFEKTRCEKVNRISSLKLDVFVDDLKEVLVKEDFPDIKKILFADDIDERHDVVNCNNWATIANETLGPFTDEDCKKIAQIILNENISEVHLIKGGGNSRIYKVLTEKNQAYVLKNYPDLLHDPRNRLQTEVETCHFLKDFHLTPKVVRYDIELNIALFEWIEGETLHCVGNDHIDQALNFVEKLKELNSPDFLQAASEACTSAEQLICQIEQRLQKLETVENKHLQNFLHDVFKPLYQEVKKWSKQNWPSNNIRKKLPKNKQTMSPSDFGFHNSILRSDGSLCFLDLEYFGLDDPVKLITDFIWHPAMNLSVAQKKRWLENSFNIFNDPEEVQQRFFASWPLYGTRWAMILLNEFHKDGWEKRVHVNEQIEHQREQKLSNQIDKAYELCALIKFHHMECPYI